MVPKLLKSKSDLSLWKKNVYPDEIKQQQNTHGHRQTCTKKLKKSFWFEGNYFVYRDK